MLQNPSKYHPNPLSHFLALHNSAAAHHAQQQQHMNNQSGHHVTHLDGVNTSLDVGKSFTIAAILGLQKNALENNQKDFSSVMNLSLNGHNHNQQLKNNLACINNNNNINNNNSSNNNNNINSNNNGSSVNSFNCDSMNSVNNVVNRYLPISSGNIGGVSSNVSANHHHMRINHFGHHATAVAVAAAAVNASNAPSALQSLQQLHHHHAQQQANLTFQRDSKLKNDNITGKKSSLKSKRVRTIFTPEQLERLEAEFERQQYMVGPERLYLAHTLQLTEAQVKVWFQNRRIKWRKNHLEITQQRLALLRQTQIATGEDVGVGVVGLGNANRNEESANNINCNSENEIRDINNANQHHSESDLSVCNDSLDADSGPEPDDT